METPFYRLSDESLLEALTEYYNKYRVNVEVAHNEEDFARCKLALMAIINELNRRRHAPAGPSNARPSEA